MRLYNRIRLVCQAVASLFLNEVSADSYLNYVTLCLDPKANVVGANQPFADASSLNNGVIPFGDVYHTTNSPFNGSGISAYFDGGTGTYKDYLRYNTAADYIFGTSDFTIETFAYPISYSNAPGLITYHQGGGAFQLTITATGLVRFQINISSSNVYTQLYGTTAIVNLNAWNHIAVVRKGRYVYLIVNGVVDATVLDIGTSAVVQSYGGNKPLYIGVGGDVTVPFTGYLSNIRITKSAVYDPTGLVVVPTEPLSNIAGTILLTLNAASVSDGKLYNNDTFIDSSLSPKVVVKQGNVGQGKFSPFGSIGGSAVFDGTTDYLYSNKLVAAGTGSITLESFVYLPYTPTTTLTVLSTRTLEAIDGVSININATTRYIAITYTGVTLFTSTTAVPLTTWSHIAVVRNGASAWRVYLDGVLLGSFSNSKNMTSTVAWIGSLNSSYAFKGFLSNVRISNTAVYTAAFTKPTSELTALASTQLLLKFNNAAIVDYSENNSLETHGVKYIPMDTVSSIGVMVFDGNSYLDTLYIKDKHDWYAGNCTIEAWVYADSWADWSYVNTTPMPVMIGNGIIGSLSNWWSFGPCADGYVRFYYYTSSANTVVSNITLSLKTWHHIAMSYIGGYISIYIDGVLAAKVAYSATATSSVTGPLLIGKLNNTALTGMISGLRMTKGIARYTDTFKPEHYVKV